jgi:hypothetical protein
MFPRNVSAGLLSAKTSAEQAAAVAAAAAAAAMEAAAVVPLQDHPNVATAGDPAAGPLGVLQLTLEVRGAVWLISGQGLQMGKVGKGDVLGWIIVM